MMMHRPTTARWLRLRRRHVSAQRPSGFWPPIWASMMSRSLTVLIVRSSVMMLPLVS